jgi:hypothetical protein
MTRFGTDLALGPYRGAVNPDRDSPELRASLADPAGLAGGSSARVLLDGRNRVTLVSVPGPDGDPERGRPQGVPGIGLQAP